MCNYVCVSVSVSVSVSIKINMRFPTSPNGGATGGTSGVCVTT